MEADNTSTEEASPHWGKRGCTLSSEALPTETKPRLLIDSLAVVSRMLYNCGWISCNSESERKSDNVCAFLCPRERDKDEREMYSSPSISINLQLYFKNSCLFIMNCDGLYFKAVAVRGGFQGFFKLCMKTTGVKSVYTSIYIYIYNVLGCLHVY